MQPMGHVQLLRHMIDHHYSPQQAIDAPRWYISHAGDTQSANDMLSNEILLEDGYDPVIKEGLKALGHKVAAEDIKNDERIIYGKAQVILQNPKTGIFVAGSDPRSDGCAIPAI
jgi:gamma-glutamyltranspeptidase/glutathione hydrolase